MDLKELEALGDAADKHWYYRAKSAAMLRLLRGTAFDEVLDVGAGSGFFSRYLLEHTACGSATCVDLNYAKDWDETAFGKPIHFTRELAQFGGHLALMMDVLEHVPDDVALLRDYAAKMPAGSRILITVPALQWMWSEHDVFLEHYRRYTRSGVDRVIAAAGLQRISSCYYFGLTLPLAAGVRLGRRALPKGDGAPKSDMKPHGRLVNSLLLGISRFELGLFEHNRLAGLTVFALAEVPA